MNGFDDLIRRQQALRAAQSPAPVRIGLPVRPPRLHGEFAKLTGGFLFGLHVFQIAADLNLVVLGQDPDGWPIGLGDDAHQAHAWLGSAREDREAIASSSREKRERFGDDGFERHLTPRERGAVVAAAVTAIARQYDLPLTRRERSAAVRCALDDPQFDESGLIVGPPVTEHAAAFLFSFRLMTEPERVQVGLDRDQHPSHRRAMPVPPPDGRGYMDGSPKQVAWAERIRAERWPSLAALVARREADLGLAPELRRCFDQVLRELDTASAKWWIEHRDEGVATIVDEAARKLAERRKRYAG